MAAYDPNKPLIIDPVLLYSTYLGGGHRDVGESIAVDGAGNAYVAGWTMSTNFPAKNALHPSVSGDTSQLAAFVAKLNTTASGEASLVYSTYLGSSVGNKGLAIAADPTGNAYVTGYTKGVFPTTPNAYQPTRPPSCCPYDVFVTKLNPTGSALLYSTFLGGSAAEEGLGIAVDVLGNAYVTGTTQSTNFPTTANAFQTTKRGGSDVFVVQLDTTASGAASLVYSTYLGGSNSSANEQGEGIAVDTLGNAYVTGTTNSLDFPLKNPYQASCSDCLDAFVAKLNTTTAACAEESLVYSTYLGGNNSDVGKGIAVDSSGNAYVTGSTRSTNFPIFPIGNPPLNSAYLTKNSGDDAFVTKLNPTGSALLYSAFLGGSDNHDGGEGIAVDAAGNAYVTGWARSSNFPMANALQPTNGGDSDAFVSKLNPAGSALVYSSYLGGNGGEEGRGIAIDSANNVYVTGHTYSLNFLLASPPLADLYQATQGGGGFEDAFITKIEIAPLDIDGDGSSPPDDCNDNDPNVRPGATEVCNGIDDDCDGADDESLTDSQTPLTQSCYSGPSDTAGVGLCYSGTQTCNNGAFGDCEGEVLPTTETCNGQDDDCDASVDESPNNPLAPLAQSCYSGSLNTAGVGLCRTGTQTCNSGSFGSCEGEVIPATEVCNSQDDDCDGQTDEGVGTTFYRDADSDGYGDATATTQACTAPAGYVADNTDCNDGSAAIHPGATEACNGVDDNCDGWADEDVQTTFYQDVDGDGFGNSSSTQQACTTPNGYVANSDDCDDGSASIHPGATEICGDGIDQNCDDQDATCPVGDTTPPTITISSPVNRETYTLNATVLSDYACEDITSGVAACTGPVASGAPFDTSVVGPHAFTVNATDVAGNPASATSTYSVLYNFTGSFSPVDNLPTLNVAKAGSAIPVKFSLSGNQGLDILAAGSPGSGVMVCNSTAPVDTIEETVSAGGSSLNYDAITDRYIYVWKTNKGWANTCRQLVMQLNDGTTYRANFKFTK